MSRSDRTGAKRKDPLVRAARALFAAVLLLVVLLVVAGPATAYSGWQHSTASAKSSCAAGCHAKATPTNATCTRCHTGFAVRGTQKCWDCHKPGQATSTWQVTAGCTATCHISTRPTGRPTYVTSYAHAPTVHDGASGYGKTCVQCHGVSTGAAAPGTSPHHDATDSRAPTCAGCHDGAIASAPSAHAGYGADCTSCHTGMDRPAGDCASCHLGGAGTTTPQITYTNTLACADAGCHGKVVNHGASPIASAPCTTCHTAHYQALGACESCHADPRRFHHGTATARPLADCAGCHDGGLAAARTSHAASACSVCHTGMDRPSAPAVCSRCHLTRTFGSSSCTSCHSATGMMGREQVHSATPRAGVSCTTCHATHNADLGTCRTCHQGVPEAHHGVMALTTTVLRLEASPATVAAGTAAVVSGSVTGAGRAPLAGVQVLLQSRPLSTAAFADVGTMTTGADGSFSQPVRPLAGTEYRVVYRGAASASSAQRPATATSRIVVAQAVRLGARPGKVRAGASVKLTGTVAPTAQQLGATAPAVTLRVERKVSSGWSKVAGRTVTPRADGAFSWSWRPRKAGSYRVRAAAAACTEVLAGISPWLTVRVR